MTGPDPNENVLRGLYQEIIIDHYRRPRHRGTLESPTRTVDRRNPLCGDEVTLQLRLEGDRVVEAAFKGQGCSVSMASASMMTGLLQGKTLDEATALAERFRQLLGGDPAAAKDPALGDLRALAGVAKFPARIRCAELPWTALTEAME